MAKKFISVGSVCRVTLQTQPKQTDPSKIWRWRNIRNIYSISSKICLAIYIRNCHGRKLILTFLSTSSFYNYNVWISFACTQKDRAIHFDLIHIISLINRTSKRGYFPTEMIQKKMTTRTQKKCRGRLQNHGVN